MNSRKGQRAALRWVSVSMVLAFAVAMGAPLAWGQAPTGGTMIARPQDHVVLTGADLGAPFVGSDIRDLRLYARSGSTWYPIPFQVDERNSDGVFVQRGTDNQDTTPYTFDSNDELVFMGFDAGSTARCAQDIPLRTDVSSWTAARITVRDPLNSQLGYLTLFEAVPTGGIPLSTLSYFTWSDPPGVFCDPNESTPKGTNCGQTARGYYRTMWPSKTSLADNVASLSLTFGAANAYNGSEFIGIADLVVNDPNGSDGWGPDALDRQQIFVDGGALGCFNERDLVTNALLNIDPTFDLVSTGPIRGVDEGTGNMAASIYGSKLNLAITFTPPVSINEITTTLDLTPTTGTGFTYFRNSNGQDGNFINHAMGGAPENAINASTTLTWWQIHDTSAAAKGGVVVTVPALSHASGTNQTAYYDGNGLTCSGGWLGCNARHVGCSGDATTWGDTGLRISGSGTSTLNAAISAYILPAGESANRGAEFYNYSRNPLVVSNVLVEGCTPTAVDITRFEATSLGEGVVEIAWETATETDNEGFNLYRGPSADGPWAKLNATLIPGQGTSFEPTEYSWTDNGLPAGTWYYRLEDVDVSGRTGSHGPVSIVIPGGCFPGASSYAALGVPILTAAVLLRPRRKRS